MVLALQPEKLSVQEGLMPGLDLCNHDPAAPCWWEVIAPPRNASQLSPAAIDAAMGIASEAALAGKDGMAAASDAIHLMEAGQSAYVAHTITQLIWNTRVPGFDVQHCDDTWTNICDRRPVAVCQPQMMLQAVGRQVPVFWVVVFASKTKFAMITL